MSRTLVLTLDPSLTRAQLVRLTLALRQLKGVLRVHTEKYPPPLPHDPDALPLDARPLDPPPPPPNGAPATLDIAQASAYIGLGVPTVRKLVQTSRIPHLKIGRRCLFLRPALDAWLAAHATPDA